MKHINEGDFEIPENREDLIRAAVSHDETCISVGGLAIDLGMFKKDNNERRDITKGCN